MSYARKVNTDNEKTAAEVLARLNPESNMPDGVLGGGSASLSEHDIAAALGDPAIPDGARYLARIKYAGQAGYYRDLAVSLYTTVMENEGKAWMTAPSHRPGLILELAKFAALDYCHINVCSACNGIAERSIGHKRVVCPDCRGTGVRVMTEEMRAQMLEISFVTWERIWRSRLGAMHAVLRGWEEKVVSALVRRLFSEP